MDDCIAVLGQLTLLKEKLDKVICFPGSNNTTSSLVFKVKDNFWQQTTVYECDNFIEAFTSLIAFIYLTLCTKKHVRNFSLLCREVLYNYHIYLFAYCFNITQLHFNKIILSLLFRIPFTIIRSRLYRQNTSPFNSVDRL